MLFRSKMTEYHTLKEILDFWNSKQGDLDKCKSAVFFGDDSIQFYEEAIKINGCQYKIVKGKDNRIWVIQEPLCQKYQPRDIKLYSERRRGQFGICFNMSDAKNREIRGCALAKRIQCYFPIKKQKEGETLYSPPILPHNKN